VYEAYSRIVIVGGPRCGKTSLAEKLGKPVLLHTDDLILDSLQESGEAIASWFAQPGPWVIEGVTAIHALLAWLETRAARPCDLVLIMWVPLARLTAAQRRMTEILKSDWAGVPLELIKRGVVVKGVRFQHGSSKRSALPGDVQPG
jgi:hypothetical protein